MSCGSFRLWIVSDDRGERLLARKHAESCPQCRQILQGHEHLRQQAALWREEDVAPPDLEEKIRSAIANLVSHPIAIITAAGPREGTVGEAHRGRSALWIALAASFLLGIGLGVLKIPATGQAPTQTRRLLDATSLDIAQREEATQIARIGELEEQVAAILAGARDKSVAIHQAARLMEYRNRIASLDVTIEDVRGFVEQNPGHPRARTMLLDAYKQKRQVLREVIALEERSS